MMLNLVIFICIPLIVSSQTEGDKCTSRHDGMVGTCRSIKNCDYALQLIKIRAMPTICFFVSLDPIVCCVMEQSSGRFGLNVTAEEATVAPIATSTETNEEPLTTQNPQVDIKFPGKIARTTKPDCPALPANETAPRTGQKAWDKCIEYQEKYLYPCLKDRKYRSSYCWSDINLYIVGGEDAYQGEFPHMALVGFGEDPDSLRFLCGASLISEHFALTAGHCLFSLEYGNPTHLVLGNLYLNENKSSNVYELKRAIPHPLFKAPNKYNDIALLETTERIKMSEYIIPACLDLGNLGEQDSAVVTGWGITARHGNQSQVLQKVELTRFDKLECFRTFPAMRTMKVGYHDNTQLCYGHKTASKDSCQGDSGGPLQVKNQLIHCMYTILGVTSFGRGCGAVGVPAIYTRVSEYVPWIESIVWAD